MSYGDSCWRSFLDWNESTQAFGDRRADVKENSRWALEGVDDEDNKCEYGLDAVVCE
jgi:hypothetical protein